MIGLKLLSRWDSTPELVAKLFLSTVKIASYVRLRRLIGDLTSATSLSRRTKIVSITSNHHRPQTLDRIVDNDQRDGSS